MPKATRKPKKILTQLTSPPTKGSMKTEAKKTCPIEILTSESLSNLFSVIFILAILITELYHHAKQKTPFGDFVFYFFKPSFLVSAL